MSALFTPFALRNLTLSNRIVVSPMCQYAATEGRATDWHKIHLGSMAQSGAGMLITEATAVEPEGRISIADLGLWDKETELALKPAINAVKQYSKIPIIMQLAHAGRKASRTVPWLGNHCIEPNELNGWRPFGPSALPHYDYETEPKVLDLGDMERILHAFVQATIRADRLGIDGLEIHAAHGFLLHQFLSPVANKRTDQYGGNLDNRMRFPLEIFGAVRAAFPTEKPVGVRISSTDWNENGWDVDDSVQFCNRLKKLGVDWIDVSSGGISTRQQIPVGPGYQVPAAGSIKHATNVPVIAVGLITEPFHAEEIVVSGQADLVALGRGMLYNPRWPWHAASKLGASVDAPPQYWRSAPTGESALFRKHL